jgi:hypothetical protein
MVGANNNNNNNNNMVRTVVCLGGTYVLFFLMGLFSSPLILYCSHSFLLVCLFRCFSMDLLLLLLLLLLRLRLAMLL